MKENRRDRRTFLKTDGTNGTEEKRNQGKDAGTPAPLPSSYHCFESRMISLFSRLELDFAIPTGGSIVNRPAEATLSWERGWG